MSGATNIAIPLLAGNSAPGNYLVESDQSAYGTPPATTIGGFCFGCQQGDIQPTAITGGPAQIIKLYGQPNPNWSLALYNALTFSYASQNLVMRRVVNTDCLTAASYLFLTSGTVAQAVDGITCAYTPYQDLNYAGGVPSFAVLPYLPSFVAMGPTAACTIIYTLNGGNAVTVNTVIGANTTYLINNINAALSSVGITCAFGNFDYTSGGNIVTANGLVFIGPTQAVMTIVSVTYNTTVHTPLPATNNYNQDVLAVIAQNPGKWPNQTFGWTITNCNFGTPQQVTLSLSRKLVTGDSLIFQCNVYTANTVVTIGTFNTVTPLITYATSNDATLQALATALSAFPYITATAVIPDTTGNNAREIIITLQEANLNGNYYAIQNNMTTINNGPLDWTTASITPQISGSGGALTATIQQAVVGVESNNTFNFNVYSTANPNVPIETFTGSLQNTMNLNGSTNILTLVNTDGVGSAYVRLVSTLPQSVIVFPNLYDNFPTINWLNGGADGSLPTNAQIAAAWNDFADKNNVNVDMLINGGYDSPIVQQAMDQVCQTRQDLCFAYLDVPSAYQESTGVQAINYRQNILNLNSNRSALFGPDVLINDPYTGAPLYVPLGGFEAALQAIADTAVGPQQAAAGTTYGILNSAQNLRVLYNKTARGNLHAAQVNVAKKLRKGGFAVYDAVTLQTNSTLLSYIPVRRILSYLEVFILELLEDTDFNNISTQLAVNTAQQVNKVLGVFINNNAIQNGVCITDSTVNNQVYANNGQFNVRVVIYPFTPDLYTVLDAVLTNDASVFTETVVSS